MYENSKENVRINTLCCDENIDKMVFRASSFFMQINDTNYTAPVSVRFHRAGENMP